MLAGLKGTRTPMYWTLDEKTRLAGCHMVREAVERVILEEGIDTYKRFMREVIEDGRRSFHQPAARADRARALPRGRVHRPALREGGAASLLRAQDTMMHAPVELRITRDGSLELDYDGASAWGYHSANCTPSSMQGALWVQLTQTLICNDKVNDGAYSACDRTSRRARWANHSNPQASTGNRVVLPDPVLHRVHQVALPLAAGARLRRGGAGAVRVHRERFQGGGIDQYGRQSATTNFGLSCVGAERRWSSTASTTPPPCGTPRATWATWRCGS